MPIKLYPMPKINFLSSEHGSVASFCSFFIGDTTDKDEIIIWGNGFRHEVKMKPNQTFEQAVTAWVTTWVKENFEPIVLPENKKAMFNQDDHVYHRIDGWNDCVSKLLELNQNAIRSEA